MISPDEPVNLDRGCFYDSQGRRITEDYIEAAVTEAESDELQIEETRAIYPRPD